MKLLKQVEKIAKKMKWYDFSMLKLSVFFFTLFLVTVWPAFRVLTLAVEWYWYLILGILFAIPLWIKMFTK